MVEGVGFMLGGGREPMEFERGRGCWDGGWI